MKRQNNNKSLEDAEFNNLCAHYKDTYEIHLASIKQRDRLFYVLLVILAFFSLQITSIDVINGIFSDFVQKNYGIAINKSSQLFSTMLWLLLFGFSSKYYQLVIYIERQYEYIHHLEDILNIQYPGTLIFTREGKSYSNNYPIFSNWVHLLYTVAFPLLILTSIIFRVGNDFVNLEPLGINWNISIASYLLVGTSTILYLGKLHKEKIVFLLKLAKTISKRICFLN